MRRRKTLVEDLTEIASLLPWWLSLVIAAIAWFALGAFVSLGRSLRNGQLLRSVASQSVDAAARYHGQDVDPLMTMSWREFEHLVGEVFRRRGYSVMETPDGADGGVDLVARRNGETMLIQCKQWRTRDVGVTVVRELRGLARKVGSGARPVPAVLAPVTPETGSGCPTCGSTMVRQVAKRGSSKGQAFLGCSRYPK